MRLFLLLLILSTATLEASIYLGRLIPPPKAAQLLIGGGQFDTGRRRATGLLEMEYKFNCRWKLVRPQIGFLTPPFRSLFVYGGIGADIYPCDWLVITPSFSPGIYFQGSGKRLGCPLEFRSGVQIAFEDRRGVRIGGEFYHISNGSLSSRNPGANSWALFITLPLCR